MVQVNKEIAHAHFEDNVGLGHEYCNRYIANIEALCEADKADLRQISLMGLYEAILNLDLNQGTLGTYSAIKCRSKMSYARRSSDMVPPRHDVQKQFGKLRRHKSALEQKHGRSVTVAEITHNFGEYTEEEALDIYAAQQAYTSLFSQIRFDEKCDSNTNDLGWIPGMSESSANPEECLLLFDEFQAMSMVVTTLKTSSRNPEELRRMVILNSGLNSSLSVHTCYEIGYRMDIKESVVERRLRQFWSECKKQTDITLNDIRLLVNALAEFRSSRPYYF